MRSRGVKVDGAVVTVTVITGEQCRGPLRAMWNGFVVARTLCICDLGLDCQSSVK
ncbi:hypothetical protein A2U01_0063768 [Trifolium medium]|uniref:Uncharacterized protein n=1 Tax=Trifolium medium TaxID=97028 RepID=A0A392S0Y3_9FABA|nr:hypothetical protein [Trifolium medium]